MNIKRFHSQFITELRYSKGELTLKRKSDEQGTYEQIASIVTTQSEHKIDHSDEILKDLEELALLIFEKFGRQDLQLTHTASQKQINGQHEFANQFLYFQFAQEITGLDSYQGNELAFELISKKYISFLEYESLPEYQEELLFDQIVVSQHTFGHILHESLGHRLESDDYSQPLSWGPVPSMNFSVHDVPGTQEMAGYSPIDDNGTEGREVCLFDPKSGISELMTAASGNCRSVNYKDHSLIRQRCLEVRTMSEELPSQDLNTLLIDKVELASFSNETTCLTVSQARLKTTEGFYKVAPLEISFNESDIKNLKAFGHKRVTNPAGGCHKGLQRGLPISYYTPKAFLKLKEA